MSSYPMLGPIVIDLLGKELNADDIRRILHPMTGGVILFGRNFESRAQITDLIKAIRAQRPNLLISVDHEGGRVQRFKTDGFTHLPAMRVLGELFEADSLHAVKITTSVGFVLGAELRAVGVDYSYAPVLDLDYGESRVIGDRAFSHDARVVALLAGALSHGLLQAGMSNCGKHFPGHGYVVADSHVDMPVDNRSLQEIVDSDVVPYQHLMHSLSGIMPAHVVYPQFDGQPAGFSSKWLQFLRQELGFTGAIVTDDLSMVGAAGMIPDVTSRVRAALDAGCDHILLCNRPEDLDETLNNLPKKYLKATSQSNLARLRAVGDELTWAQLQKESRYLAAKKEISPYLSGAKGVDPTAVMLCSSVK